ncbi:hypothetical protein, partial [Muribaculum intestinale]|uniref:hypothetical protein n=1 Tax=Muribaculum intestinale TaxID=1796646 RepID=UPI0026DF05B4
MSVAVAQLLARLGHYVPHPPDRPSARPAQCPAVAVAFDEYVEHRGVDRVFLDQLDGQPGVRLRSLVVTVAGEK